MTSCARAASVRAVAAPLAVASAAERSTLARSLAASVPPAVTRPLASTVTLAYAPGVTTAGSVAVIVVVPLPVMSPESVIVSFAPIGT